MISMSGYGHNQLYILLIGIALSSYFIFGYALFPAFIAYAEFDTVLNHPELLQLLDQGYTIICLDDLVLGWIQTSCIVNADEYEIEQRFEWVEFTSSNHCSYTELINGEVLERGCENIPSNMMYKLGNWQINYIIGGDGTPLDEYDDNEKLIFLEWKN